MPAFVGLFVVVGAFGGLLPDLIRFVKEKEKGFPEWFSKPGYWVGLGVLVVLGGLAAWLGQATKWQSALAMGYGAPEFLSRLIAKDSVTMKGAAGGFPLRKWWAQ